MSEDKSDKQYEPTEQRLAEARKRGEVPRSIELNAGFMYIGSWLAFVVLSGFTVRYWLAMTQRGMGAEGWPEGDPLRWHERWRVMPASRFWDWR